MGNPELQGTLFKYGPGPSHLAFRSGAPSARCVVLVGGLTDGLLFAPYCGLLSERLAAEGWGLVQAQLSSSYQVGLGGGLGGAGRAVGRWAGRGLGGGLGGVGSGGATLPAVGRGPGLLSG